MPMVAGVIRHVNQEVSVGKGEILSDVFREKEEHPCRITVLLRRECYKSVWPGGRFSNNTFIAVLYEVHVSILKMEGL